MEQTPAERIELLRRGKDGLIFCLDMDEAEGQDVANMLAEYAVEVAKALTLRHAAKTRYLMVLLPASRDGHAVVVMTTTLTLNMGIKQIHRRSADFGEWFSVVVVPNDPDIAAVFLGLQDCAGTA